MSNVEKIPYIRVGTTYYKMVNQPLSEKESVEQLVVWSRQNIAQDHGLAYFDKILKYDSFCNIPDHFNYKKVHCNSYNIYKPFEHVPKQGDCSEVINFLNHIFGDQFELGLDYVKLLVERPMQILPVLCLVSEQRNTGKTTFLNFLKDLFGGNMTINTNDDFRSQFNSDWASKLIIGVDEVLLDKKEDSEKIKNLSTARTFKAEAKGKDRIEVAFFGKFILCSNNETTFIQVDPEETRYWIKKLPQLKNDNINLLALLRIQIPAFLQFLKNRALKTEGKTRMWFTPEQIRTEALARVLHYGSSFIERELHEILRDQFTKFEREEICFTNGDLVDLLKESNIKVNRSSITAILRDKWKMEPCENGSTYKRFFLSQAGGDSVQIMDETKKGRYFVFRKDEFDKIM